MGNLESKFMKTLETECNTRRRAIEKKIIKWEMIDQKERERERKIWVAKEVKKQNIAYLNWKSKQTGETLKKIEESEHGKL